MSISKINNPDFAGKLMSTFYMGAPLSDEEQTECEKIWAENDNNRSEVLKKVVEICGDINTPQTRFLKAQAWSFNSTIYSKERIEAINNYLSNELYFEAFKNNVVTLEKGEKKGEKFHRALFLEYLATAYNSLKDYDNCERTFKEIIELGTDVPNGYCLLADFYRKRGNLDLAIETLKSGKKTLNYLINNNFKQSINQTIEQYEKLKIGMRKHTFTLFDTYPNTWINNTYRQDLEKAHLNLREEYKEVFETHRKLINNIENIEFICKENNTNFYDEDDYKKYCIEDIELYSKIMSFYNKLNKLGFGYKMEYEDNGRSEYTSFKKLINYYAKNKDYNNAIKICELSIENGITNYTPSKTMKDKIEEFSKKVD